VSARADVAIMLRAKVIGHVRQVAFQMAELAISKNLFAAVTRMIVDLRLSPAHQPGAANLSSSALIVMPEITGDYGDTCMFSRFPMIPFIVTSGAVHGADRPICRSRTSPSRDRARQSARAGVLVQRGL
jgi:hypothetical protein